MEIKLNEKKLNKIKMLMRQSSKIGNQLILILAIIDLLIFCNMKINLY